MATVVACGGERVNELFHKKDLEKTMEVRLLLIWACIVALGSLTYVSAEVNDTRKSLRLLGFLPMAGKGWVGGAGCLPAITMAVDDVNARADVLPDYQLDYHWIDTQCNPGLAVYRMFKEVGSSAPYVMLLGAGCSTESEATSQTSHLWHLTQLSYGSSSPILSDRSRFPMFFRLAGPDQMLNPARIALMKNFDWKKVATINQALEFFSVVIDDFVQRTKKTDATIISQEIFVNDPTSRVENLKKHDARIIMTAMYEDKARKLLCAAYKVGLYGPKIVWVFTGWYSSHFWSKDLHEVDCTEKQMAAVAEGTLVTSFYYQNPDPVRGVANMTAEEFNERYVNSQYYNPDASMFDYVAAPCYDHIWVAALALHCADKGLTSAGHNKTLNEFEYYDADIGQAVFDCMGNVSMTGIIGNIAFENGADPIRNVKIEQIRNGQRTEAGAYRTDKSPRRFEWTGSGIVWKDGNIPRDSTHLIIQEVRIPDSLYAAMATFAGVGILLAVGLFSFNIIFRNNATVKLSSPNINNVLLLGCIMCYAVVFLKPTETSDPVVCKTKTFLLSLGFTTAFGALFSKTWRVYKIFTNKKLLRMSIKDVQLLGIICALLSIVLLVLIIWEIVSPQYMVKTFLDNMVYTMANDTEVRPFVRVCISPYSDHFSWALYVMEGALLTFGAFLAWETRHVKIVALNDSHLIGMCLYNVVVLSAVGLTLILLLDQQVVILYGMTSGCLIIGTTLTQIVVFAPKVLAVYHNAPPTELTGQTIQTKPSQSQTMPTTTTAGPPSGTLALAKSGPGPTLPEVDV